MKQFETIDISGDAGIRAFGRDLPELFANAAAGMYSLVTDLSGVAETGRIDVSVHSETLEGLLVAWLNELIFRFDAYGFVGKKIAIGDLTDIGVSATLSGEEFDPAKHEQKLLVKAATYHRLSIHKKDDHWEAEVVFDI
ncbi:MAG: archease [Nitrospirae bacterium]|nr:archease [Nitrospirota bacterium]